MHFDRSEFSSRFTHIPGKVILSDPDFFEIAQVDQSEFTQYLSLHNLCCEADLGQKPVWPDVFRNVFDAQYLDILRRSSHFPTVRVPTLSLHEDKEDQERLDYSSWTYHYTMESMTDVLLRRLQRALELYAFAFHSCGGVESEFVGNRGKWRDWFMNDVFDHLSKARVVLPPGGYGYSVCVIVSREDAGPVSEYLETLPHTHWRDWAPAEVYNALTY